MKILSSNPPAWDTAPPEVWRDWQFRRLRDYLSHRVLPFSAHYNRLFKEHGLEVGDLKSFDDWSDAPFTTKADLTVPREQQREFILMPHEATLR